MKSITEIINEDNFKHEARLFDYCVYGFPKDVAEEHGLDKDGTDVGGNTILYKKINNDPNSRDFAVSYSLFQFTKMVNERTVDTKNYVWVIGEKDLDYWKNKKRK